MKPFISTADQAVMPHAQTCRVCEQAAAYPYTDPYWSRPEQHPLLRCDGCGSLFSWPLPGQATLADFYRTQFDYRWYECFYPAKLLDANSRIAELRPYLGTRVLDFGGGQGYFARAASDHGLTSRTYDPMMTADAVRPDHKAWDSVVALHVLEHSNQPEALLHEMSRYLLPGGHLVLAVPNAAGAGYRKHGMAWVWAQPPLIHIFHFTLEGLTTLLERCGFDVVKADFHDRWDANYEGDVLHRRRQQFIDRLWGFKLFNYFAPSRKILARCQAAYRRHLLGRSLRQPVPAADRAELLLIARLKQD